MRIVLALIVLALLTVPALAQDPVRGDWVACPNALKTAGVCVDGEAIFYIIAPIAMSVKARDATCGVNSYQVEIDGEPNPEPCKKFAVRQVYRIWRDWYSAWSATTSAQAAYQAALLAAKDELGDVTPEG